MPTLQTFNCPLLVFRMHVMAGKRQAGVDESLQDQTFIENITYAAERLQKVDLTCYLKSQEAIPMLFLSIIQ